MPDEVKNFGGSLVLEFEKWWRHVKTIYSLVICVKSPHSLVPRSFGFLIQTTGE